MDATTPKMLTSFSCKIRIQEAKNIEFKSPKNLFVRYYLICTGNNNERRIRLNTKKISSKSEFIWNESFSLECLGTEDSIHSCLKQATVTLELRRAKTLPFLSGSELLGRTKIPWDQVFGSPNMEFDKWVCLVRDGFSFKQPKLKVGMRVIRDVDEEIKRKKPRFGNSISDHECGCCKSHMGYSADHDFFALAAAMEFL